MPASWTVQQILDFAPDASSAKNGKGLANPGKWVSFGQTEQAIWGECKGSGSKPYQTQIDLSEPAFKCSCPSRKFPCKHGLGLFLIWAEQPALLDRTPPPEWVEKWLQGRQQRAKPKDPQDPSTEAKRAVQQAKRAAARESKVSAGLQDLELWMRDLVRQGLATAQGKDYSYWEQPAARLIDAQARTLATQVRQMAGIPHQGVNWPEKLLAQLGSLHLLLEGYKRLETLSAGLQAEIRTLIGWTQTSEDLLQQAGLRDRWLVLGQYVEEVATEKDLRVQRTWLWGQQSNQPATILDFAFGSRPFEINFVTGTCVDAELVFYESAYPLRALLKTRYDAPMSLDRWAGSETIAGVLKSYSEALARNPWLDLFPVSLKAVTPFQTQHWGIYDPAGYWLPLAPNFNNGWTLLALSGGHPIGLFGEWNGEYFTPLSAWANQQFVTIGNR